MSVRSRAGAIASWTTVAVATTIASLWLKKSVSKFGWEGTLRYIWEGDPYSPETRKAIEKLQKVERSIQKKEEMLLHLELTLAQARLDSVDDAVVVPQWMVTYTPRNLEKDLALLSHDLDTLVATVDSVPSMDDSDIKKRKKTCSQQLVFMMERADVLLDCYNSQTEKQVSR